MHIFWLLLVLLLFALKLRLCLVWVCKWKVFQGSSLLILFVAFLLLMRLFVVSVCIMSLLKLSVKAIMLTVTASQILVLATLLRYPTLVFLSPRWVTFLVMILSFISWLTFSGLNVLIKLLLVV